MGFSNFIGRRVLVTGASGFIGRSLVRRLLDIGADVYSMWHVNPVEGKECPCNIESQPEVLDLVFDVQPEFVFHLAAQAIVTTAENSPRVALDTNVVGAINLFSALRLLEEAHPNTLHGVICASTDKVFGRQERLPYTEDMALLGVRQVYEASKTCEDVLAQMAAWAWKLPIAITRFGNVYGPGDTNLTRIVPGTIKSYMLGDSPIIRSDGQAYRDYVYIDDVVDGYLKLAEYVDTHREGCPHIFNFGTNKFSRVLDVVMLISTYFKDSLPPSVEYGAKDEIRKQYVSGAKAKAVLGWKPQTLLKDGIAETVAWWRHYVQSN